jgi:hypothetical protein
MKPNAHRVVMASRQPTSPDDPDFFPTPPWGARAGGELIKRLDPRLASIWEPCCGAGHMVHGLKDYGLVWASDAYGYDGNMIADFLDDGAAESMAAAFAPDWIVGNPPFNQIEAFIRQAWRLAPRGVAMLMRAAALESVGRHSLLYRDCPLTVFAPFSERLPMAKGRWEPDLSSAAFYAWFIWLKPALRPQRFMARLGGDWFPATVPIPPGSEVRLTRADDALLFGAADRSRVAA